MDIRQEFLDFFQRKGNKLYASSNLVHIDDEGTIMSYIIIFSC